MQQGKVSFCMSQLGSYVFTREGTRLIHTFIQSGVDITCHEHMLKLKGADIVKMSIGKQFRNKLFLFKNDWHLISTVSSMKCFYYMQKLQHALSNINRDVQDFFFSKQFNFIFCRRGYVIPKKYYAWKANKIEQLCYCIKV